MLGEFIAAQMAANGTARNFQRVIDEGDSTIEKWKNYSKRLELRLAYERSRRKGWQKDGLALEAVLAAKGADVLAEVTHLKEEYIKEHGDELAEKLDALTAKMEAQGQAELKPEDNGGY